MCVKSNPVIDVVLKSKSVNDDIVPFTFIVFSIVHGFKYNEVIISFGPTVNVYKLLLSAKSKLGNKLQII